LSSLFPPTFTSDSYTLSLHDALPILIVGELSPKGLSVQGGDQDDVLLIPYTSAMKRVTGQTTLRSINVQAEDASVIATAQQQIIDRKSTRLNSSHLGISYAVFCLKKK